LLHLIGETLDIEDTPSLSLFPPTTEVYLAESDAIILISKLLPVGGIFFLVLSS